MRFFNGVLMGKILGPFCVKKRYVIVDGCEEPSWSIYQPIVEIYRIPSIAELINVDPRNTRHTFCHKRKQGYRSVFRVGKDAVRIRIRRNDYYEIRPIDKRVDITIILGNEKVSTRASKREIQAIIKETGPINPNHLLDFTPNQLRRYLKQQSDKYKELGPEQYSTYSKYCRVLKHRVKRKSLL